MKKSTLLSTTACLLILFFFASSAISQTTTWLWAHSAGNISYDQSQAVTSDNLGNSFLAGYYNATLQLDPDHIFANSGAADMVLVKYDPNGVLLWATHAGGSDGDIPTAVTLDKDGNVFVSGYFKSPSLTFGTITLTNAGGNTYDLFLVKYDPDGNVIWATSVGGTGDDRAYGAAVDTSGNCIITGYFVSSSVTFGPSVLLNTGGTDLFLAKYSPDGTPLWGFSGIGEAFDYSNSVAVDKFGNSYITGYFNSGTLTLGPIVLNQGANRDIMIAKFSPLGLPLWAMRAGTSSDNFGNSIAVDTLANCFVAGSFKGNTLVFGTTTLTNAGNADAFVVKLTTDGVPVWAQSVGGTLEDAATSVAVDAGGYSHIAGYFKSASATVGATTLINAGSGTADMYMSEYNPDGNLILAKSAGGTGDEVPYSIAMGPVRTFYMAGYFSSPTFILDQNTLINEGTTDMFITKSNNVSVTGISDPGTAQAFRLYPNPAKDYITVNLPSHSIVEICNLQGIVCQSITTTTDGATLDIRNLASGIYVIKATTNNQVVTSKFIRE